MVVDELMEGTALVALVVARGATAADFLDILVLLAGGASLIVSASLPEGLSAGARMFN